jgi:hypothetical protein
MLFRLWLSMRPSSNAGHTHTHTHTHTLSASTGLFSCHYSLNNTIHQLLTHKIGVDSSHEVLVQHLMTLALRFKDTG